MLNKRKGDGGSGDVVGPGGAVDGNLAAFDAATGKLIKDSGISGLGGGSGDVVGPAGATDGNLAVFDAVTGKRIKDSGKSAANLSGTNTGDETATRMGALINGAAAKTPPVDADMLGLMDSAAANVLAKLSWANVKAALKTYFDALYTLANLGGIAHSLATAADDFLVASGSGAFVKKTLAEVKTILGLGSAAYTASGDYAVVAKGVTNGDSHDHAGGDGAQIDHGGLAGLSDDDHPQYTKHSLATAANDFLVASGSGVFEKKTLAETQAILAKAAPSLDAISTPFLVAKDQATLTILANTYVKLISAAGVHSIISFDAATDVVIATALDTGAIAAGLDYCVYVCNDGLVKVSLATTFPAGYDANISRKIGGFHTLSSAVGTISGHSLTTFATAAVLPASVWCLNFRPTCEPAGMVYSDLAKIWVDIYLQTGIGTTPTSVYGAAIKDTQVWNDHVDYLAAQGKKLLKDPQFQTISKGSNQKTNIYGSLKPVLNALTVGYAGKCAPLAFTGSGLNDLTINRTAYVPPGGATNEAQEYEIEIDATGTPNTVKWRKRNPAGTYGSYTTGVSCASPITIDGAVFTFAASTGHTLGNKWNFYVMNGLVDTANRRMVSNIGVEGAAGVFWQWLQDQSYRYDMDALPVHTVLTQTATIYDIASPGGNPIYLKFTASGMPYLCSNLATVTADRYLPMGSNHKLQITHDAGAATGIQVFVKKANTIADRLVCVVPTLKDAYLPTSAPELWVKVKYDAGAAANVAVNFDDGADQRLEANMTGGNTTIDLGAFAPTWAYQDAGSNEGLINKQGTYGDAKLLAGGAWYHGTICGSRCRSASCFRWDASASYGARGCAEPR